MADVKDKEKIDKNVKGKVEDKNKNKNDKSEKKGGKKKKRKLFDKFLSKCGVKNPEDNPKRRNAYKKGMMIGVCLVCLLYAVMLRDMVVLDGIDPETQTHAEFKKAMDKGKILGVWLSSGGDQILYQYKSDIKDKELLEESISDIPIYKLDKTKWYATGYMEYDNLKEELTVHDLTLITGAFDRLFGTTFNFLLSISTTVFMLYFIFVMMSNMMKQMGGDSTKYEINTKTGVTFENVIGHEEVIEDIRQYIMLLDKQKENLKDLPVKAPRGILFTGPPGTGKTLLAKAMAGEADVPFIYLNTSNVIEMFVGVGARTIRNCFKKAREKAPCIVFLDEIDAIGGSRGSVAISNSENNQTLLALLQELDGFSNLDNILVIAATNKPGDLDSALLRSGRFDRQVQINMPMRAETRKEMLEFYLKEYKLDETVDLDIFSKQLSGMSGADIANICNEAAVINLMNNKGELKTLSMHDLSEALDKLLLKGNKLSDKKRVNEEDRRVVAYHEAGHATMTYLTGGEIGRVSTHPTTSGVGGFVMHVEPDSQFRSKKDLLDRIKVAYAGRCSEHIKFGDDRITTGASNDIKQATNILESMYLCYGFSDDLGLLDYQSLVKNRVVSPQMVYRELKEAANRIMNDTMDLLRENYRAVEALAEELLEKELLTGEEAGEIIRKALDK